MLNSLTNSLGFSYIMWMNIPQNCFYELIISVCGWTPDGNFSDISMPSLIVSVWVKGITCTNLMPEAVVITD